MPPSDSTSLQDFDADLTKIQAILDQHPPLFTLFEHQPHLLLHDKMVKFIFALNDLDLLSAPLGETNVACALACFLERTPANTLHGIVDLCCFFFEESELTINHLRFLFQLENAENLVTFNCFLNRLYDANCLTPATTNQIFFTLTNVTLLNDANEIDSLFYQHFPTEHFKKYWEIILPAVAIEPASAAILLATLQEFKKQNEFTEENLDGFFACIKRFMDENNPTQKKMAQALGTLFQQVFHLFYWSHNTDLSKTMLAKKPVVDIFFMTGVTASQLVTMPPALRQHYFDAIEQSIFFLNDTKIFKLDFLCDLLRQYLNSFLEEIISVLNFETQNNIYAFCSLLIKTEELELLKRDTFDAYFRAFLKVDFLNAFQILSHVIFRSGVALENSPEIFWTMLLDIRFVDSRVPNMLGEIISLFDNINAFDLNRLISVLQSFQIDEKTTTEDFIKKLEAKLQDIKQFLIDGIDEDLANLLCAGRNAFYELCRIGLSFSKFIALAPELQKELLSNSSGYANAIVFLSEKNLFLLDEIIELYDYDISICHKLLCAPEEVEYQKFARETLHHHRIANHTWNQQQDFSQHQNPSAFLARSRSVMACSATEQNASTTMHPSQ